MEEYFVDAAVPAVIDFFQSGRKAYDVEIDDEVIRMSGAPWGLNKRVRRGRIRYVHEVKENFLRESALKISEHGPVGTYFLGCVLIPATVPEYEQIKALAMTWKAIG